MRLDDIDTSDVEVDDQRGQGGGGGFPMGGGGGLPLGRSMGCGTILLLIAVAYFSGGNLGSLMDTGGGGAPTQATPQAQMAAGQGCDANALSKQSCQVLALGNTTWGQMFGSDYRKPHIAFYTGGGQSGCGAAQSAMGPFYCPADEGIYIDTDFYRELQQRFGAKGDFAQDYVIAHELGHHIQKLTGVAAKVQQRQENSSRAQGNRYQVAMELQADCYAGVWAAKNAERMDPGDIEEGMTAAHAIGDDVLQRQAQGVVVPESFTHGSAQQRMTWLKRGLDSGDPKQCDTFN
ncbi:MAG: hypothetical protein RL367_1475 [Pseudomonadota bacterium]